MNLFGGILTYFCTHEMSTFLGYLKVVDVGKNNAEEETKEWQRNCVDGQLLNRQRKVVVRRLAKQHIGKKK